jgi:hypothetical protein
VRLLREWLDAAGIIEGALFRQLPKGGKRVGDRLGGSAYYDVIKQGIAGIGLDGSKFGSHSMRSDLDGGGERRQRLEDEGNIPAQEHVLAGYIREAELFQQHASVGMY